MRGEQHTGGGQSRRSEKEARVEGGERASCPQVHKFRKYEHLRVAVHPCAIVTHRCEQM